MTQNGDSDCLDSWESLDDPNTLEKQIEKLASKCATENQSNKNGTVILLQSDSIRYGPPQPGLKILKRPNGFNHNIQNVEDRPKQPLKTLQQREVEYAKARERILGESNNIQESEEGPTEILTKSMQQYNEVQQSETTCERRLIHIETRPAVKFGAYRLPRGPDGTTGFHTNR